jgi:hypothetical protein
LKHLHPFSLIDLNFHANEVPFSTFGLSAAYLTGSWPADVASASLSLLPSVKDLTSDAFTLATCSRINISARHGSRAMIAS